MDQPTKNQQRALGVAAIFGVIVALVLGLIAGLIVGVAGIAVGVVVGALAAWAVVGTAWTTNLVLRLSRAEPADPDTFARLHNVVEGLCSPSGMAKPAIYVIDDTAPNALVVGRHPKDAALAVTTGLLDLLDLLELEAVVARELTLIKSGAIAPATVAVTTAGLPALLGDICIRRRWWNGGRAGHPEDRAAGRSFLGAIGSAHLALSPLDSALLRAALGPDLGPEADAAAAVMTRYPPGLASAMERIGSASTVVHAGLRSTAHLWLAPPIATDPAEGQFSEANRLFVAHRSSVERIDALREL